jgi:hypothetical protein
MLSDEELQVRNVVIVETGRAFGQMWAADGDAALGLDHLEASLAFVVHGLLDIKDAVGAAEAGEEVLRALVDEVPAQMRKNEQRTARHGEFLQCSFGYSAAAPLRGETIANVT